MTEHPHAQVQRFAPAPINPVLVALDVPTAEQAVRIAMAVAPHVGGFKVGLQLLMGPGPALVAAVAELGLPVFADAKLHDIPNTVAGAAAAIARLGARWVTIHGAGGRAMLEAAVEATASTETGILVVTALTSLDASDLAATGVSGTVGRHVVRMTRLAVEAGVEGVVCSAQELGDVAQVAPPGLIRVVPGIRPHGAEHHDQARTATPEEAIRRGATHLVIGRPITGARDPVEAARSIEQQLTPLRATTE